MSPFKSNDIDHSGQKQPVEESITLLSVKPVDTWNLEVQLCFTKQAGCRVKYSAISLDLASCLGTTSSV